MFDWYWLLAGIDSPPALKDLYERFELPALSLPVVKSLSRTGDVVSAKCTGTARCIARSLLISPDGTYSLTLRKDASSDVVHRSAELSKDGTTVTISSSDGKSCSWWKVADSEDLLKELEKLPDDAAMTYVKEYFKSRSETFERFTKLESAILWWVRTAMHDVGPRPDDTSSASASREDESEAVALDFTTTWLPDAGRYMLAKKDETLVLDQGRRRCRDGIVGVGYLAVLGDEHDRVVIGTEYGTFELWTSRTCEYIRPLGYTTRVVCISSDGRSMTTEDRGTW